MKTCIICGEELPKGKSKYCSDECVYESILEKQRIRYKNYDRKQGRKKLFCAMTGMTRERYLELKEFMGIN